MLKRIKNLASIVLIAVTASTAAASLGASSANAGLILAPIGVGIILIIVGVADQSLGWVVLSNPDGSLEQDSLSADLSANLMSKYQRFGIDTQTASDLAALITAKCQASKPDAGGKINLSFTPAELSQGLQATNIEADNPALFQQLVADLS